MIAERKRVGRGNGCYAGAALPVAQQGKHQAVGVDGDIVLLPVGAHFAYGGGFAVFGGRLHGDLR